MDKSTGSRVLQDGTGFRGGPKGEDGAIKFSPSWGAGRGGDGMEQDKIMWGRGEDPILQPCPAPLPSLILRHVSHLI